MQAATTMDAEVILLAYLPFSTHPGRPNRQRIAERQRLLYRRRPLRRAAAQRAVHAIDVRRTRMTANLAKPFLHHDDSSQVPCRKIVAEVGRGRAKLFYQ
jgi:hypothetical protein